MSTLKQPQLERFIDEHAAEILSAWVEQDLLGPHGLLRVRGSQTSDSRKLRELGDIVLDLQAGRGVPYLVQWLSEGRLGNHPPDFVLHAIQLLHRRVRKALYAFKDAGANGDEFFHRAIDAFHANAAATIRGVFDVQLRDTRAARTEGDADFHTLAGILRDPLFSISPTGQVQYLSPGIAQLTGHSPAQFVANPQLFAHIVVPEDRRELQRLIKKVTSSRRPHEASYRVRHQRSGEIRHILNHASPVVEDGVVVRIDGVMVDVTDRRELESRLERSEHLRSLGQLAGGIAHDFNNLLVSILGYADLLLARSRPGSKEANALELIAAAAERGASLTERLLTFARGSRSSEKRPTRLENVLRNTIALVTPSIPHSVRLTLVEGEDVPVAVANSAAVGEAILNLVLNGAQACERGGGTQVTVTIRKARPAELELVGIERGVTIEVSDDGPGMNPDVLRRVFEPLFTTRGDRGGTGLGCTMAQSIAQDHGGALSCVSRPGEGASFYFIIPAAAPNVVPVRSGRRVGPTPVARIRGARHVLVAEDETSVRQLVTDVLEGAGYRVTGVANGQEAVDLVAHDAEAFDLVILDVMMQPVDGTEAFLKLAEIAPTLPVIFCTGYSDATRVYRPSVLEGAAIIQKPFRAVDLVETVRTHVRRRK